MTAPQIPRLADVLGPAIDQLVKVRPTVQPHLDDGHYGDVVTGLGGQVQVSRRRLALEAAASSLGSASGDELTELARSEFDTLRLDAPTTSVGEILLARAVVHYRADSSTAATALSGQSAVDFGTLSTLLYALASAAQAHGPSAYNPATGLGVHISADLTSQVTVAPSDLATMDLVVGKLTNLQDALIAHITTGGIGTWHPTADTTTLGTLTAPFVSNTGQPFTSQSTASQKSATKFLNALVAGALAHYAKEAPAGVISSAITWTVAANSTAVPPILGAKYTASADVSVLTGQSGSLTVPVLTGQGLVVAPIMLPIQATKTGLGGNLPVSSSVPGYLLPPPPLPMLLYPGQNLNFGVTPIPTANQPLFDTNLAPTAIYAAGGGQGQTDPTLRVASTARFTGRYGPTPGALVAGAYADGQAASAPVLEDATTGTSYFYAADQSWATSHAWRTGIEQDIRDTWLGAGCRLLQGSFVNCPVRIEATVVLRSAQYLSNTSDISAAIVAELAAYFDDRPDWYAWKTSAIKGVIAQTDHRILSCSLVIVKASDGHVLAEPPAPVAGQYLTHWAFSEQGFLPTYSAPV